MRASAESDTEGLRGGAEVDEPTRHREHGAVGRRSDPLVGAAEEVAEGTAERVVGDDAGADLVRDDDRRARTFGGGGDHGVEHRIELLGGERLVGHQLVGDPQREAVDDNTRVGFGGGDGLGEGAGEDPGLDAHPAAGDDVVVARQRFEVVLVVDPVVRGGVVRLAVVGQGLGEAPQVEAAAPRGGRLVRLLDGKVDAQGEDAPALDLLGAGGGGQERGEPAQEGSPSNPPPGRPRGWPPDAVWPQKYRFSENRLLS